MLIDRQIEQLGLVVPCIKENFKNSTYDLTIGEIFPMGTESKESGRGLNEYWLEPSSMVAVRTTEKVVLPSHVTGLATLVTSLTHDGLLCLNVGVIDPGYDGHISAFLVNFSSRPRKIALNHRLLRVLFFTHNTVQKLEPLKNQKATYQSFLKNKASNEFSNTFLDSAGLTELARKSAWKVVLDAFFSKWINVVSVLIAVLSLAVAVITYLSASQ
ncbi:hypothetical protein GS634_11930 [Ruegeria atlantica]|uniref:dUTPase-like domain-containing protein n=1 Tax=Ruegeria atlantica TaxID=81569 RepID=A0AA90YVX6_9RHOB|nr:hypothetical protein [Ruegeria atlantica]NOE18830.1 hypothetical protein [Ruegeria atlantica]